MRLQNIAFAFPSRSVTLISYVLFVNIFAKVGIATFTTNNDKASKLTTAISQIAPSSWGKFFSRINSPGNKNESCGACSVCNEYLRKLACSTLNSTIDIKISCIVIQASENSTKVLLNSNSPFIWVCCDQCGSGENMREHYTLVVQGPEPEAQDFLKNLMIQVKLSRKNNVCLQTHCASSSNLMGSSLNQTSLFYNWRDGKCVSLNETGQSEPKFKRNYSRSIFHANKIDRRTRSLRKGRDVRNSGSKKTLIILGLFEFSQNNSTRKGGKSEEIAAKIALDDINSKEIVRGYRLVMHTNDTQCDPGTGVDAFFHALYARPVGRIVSLLGTACSEVTERLAKVATYQNIVQVSFGSTSPSLSDKKEFPSFYRTVAPVSSHSEAIIELIRHFQWDTVTFFTKNENRFTMPANFLASELEKTNVTCKATLTFSVSDYRDQLQDMKKLDSRIIIANFGADVAPLVFCEVYRMGMFGSDYAWILIGEPEKEWWRESGSSSSSTVKNSGFHNPSSKLVSNSSSFPSSTKRQKRRPSTDRRKRSIQRSREQSNLSSHPSSGIELEGAYSSLSSEGKRNKKSVSLGKGIHIRTDTDGKGLFRTKTQEEKQSQLVHEAGAFSSKMDLDLVIEQQRKHGDETMEKTGKWKSDSFSRDWSNKNNRSRSTSTSTSSRTRNNRSADSSLAGITQFSGPIKHSSSPSNPRTLGLQSRGKSYKLVSQPPTECSFKQLTEAVQYAIIVDRYNTLEQKSYSGMTTADFMNRLQKRLVTEKVWSDNTEKVWSPLTPETYDAVWTVALGLQQLQYRNDNYDFDQINKERFSSDLQNEIGKLNFVGVSGPIRFQGSDRVGITSFMQIQDGKKVQVGLHFPEGSTKNELDLSCKDCQKIRWHGNQVPISRREFRFKLIRVDYSFYVTVAIVASCGIVLAAVFLAFNLYHRRLKYIKLSSPKLNNVVILGCIFAYFAVILLGTDFTTVPDGENFAYICTIRAYLLSMAFSLAFGAMFAKTYRVYRIFTRSCIGVVKNKLLKDAQLMTLIMVLVLVDCIIVTSWALFDPMHVKLRNLSLEIDPSDRTVVYQPQIEVCRSQHAHVWLSVLYGYKSLLLVVGLYMAWETRHVKIQALNDSKYIGLCVYIVVLTSVLAVSLANLISERVTLSFVSVTSLILFATTVTLCLLFLPKIHAIINKANASDPIVESMGLKIECNTRRFIVEDTKELLFRAEVQNRVFKRQIEAMDVEIWRLEHMLEHSPSKYANDKMFSHRNFNLKEGNKKGKRKSVANGAGESTGEDLEFPQEDSESSDDNDSTSSYFEVYLHGPRFIVPISLFNFKNNRVNFNSPNCGGSRVADANDSGLAAPSGSSNAPRSSWPNSRTLWPLTNGLIRKKHQFKSEPRLAVEPLSHEHNMEGTKRNLLSLFRPTFDDASRRSSHQPSVLPPPTIIQWEEGEVGVPFRDAIEDDEEILRKFRGVSANNSPDNRSRKTSSASGTGSKRSSIFSAFKNPWAYLTGMITKGNENDESRYSAPNHGHRLSQASSADIESGGLLKPIPYFSGQTRLSVPGTGTNITNIKFSSVPDLWAVRGSSPDADVLRSHPKKYSVNSDTAVVGSSSGAIIIPSSAESVQAKVSDPDPVLKLIVASHESVYL